MLTMVLILFGTVDVLCFILVGFTTRSSVSMYCRIETRKPTKKQIPERHRMSVCNIYYIVILSIIYLFISVYFSICYLLYPFIKDISFRFRSISYCEFFVYML